MGGRHSTQSVKDSSSVVTDALLEQVQSCVQTTDGKNVISVDGSDNRVEGDVQKMRISINKKCASSALAKNDFSAKLSSSVAQKLKDQNIALTSWASASKDDQSSLIANSIKRNVTTKVSQNCMTKISGSNVLDVRGTGNIVKNDVQLQTQSALSSCMQGTSSYNTATADVSNLANQYQQNISKNPLDFIANAIKAFTGNIWGAIIAVVIVIALVVVGTKMLHGKNDGNDNGNDNGNWGPPHQLFSQFRGQAASR